jgi:hypothetical protein
MTWKIKGIGIALIILFAISTIVAIWFGYKYFSLNDAVNHQTDLVFTQIVFKDGDEVLGIYNDNEARKDQQLYSVLSSDKIVAAGWKVEFKTDSVLGKSIVKINEHGEFTQNEYWKITSPTNDSCRHEVGNYCGEGISFLYLDEVNVFEISLTKN